MQRHLLGAPPGYGSAIGSHSNHIFRAFALGALHSDERVTVQGVLSLDRLLKADPAFGKAVRDGITWTVVSHEVQMQFPKFAELLPASGNATIRLP